MAARVSLAELAAAGIVLHVEEATAIVLEICHQYTRGSVPGIPSAPVIRLTPDGVLLAEGPITTDRPPIAAAAQLLEDLLPPYDAPPPYRVPGGLRLIVARALGTLDLPPFGSLDDWCRALARFASEDLAGTARNLYQAWARAHTPRTLTISDVRRARRATGLSLDDISLACGVRADQLRELEWGYFKNWRIDGVGLSWLAGYAKASGLDERVVTSIAVPMMEQQLSPEDETALVSSGPQQLVPWPMPESDLASAPAMASVSEAGSEPEAAASPRARIRVWMIPAAAAFVLAVITAALWPRPAVPTRADAVTPAVSPETVSRAPETVSREPETVSGGPEMVTREPVHLVPAVQMHPAAPRTSKPHKTVKRASHTGDTQAPSHKPGETRASRPGFFSRPLLRIVLK
jgi:hypothetical protein